MGYYAASLYPQHLSDYPGRTLNPMRLAQPPVLMARRRRRRYAGRPNGRLFYRTTGSYMQDLWFRMYVIPGGASLLIYGRIRAHQRPALRHQPE